MRRELLHSDGRIVPLAPSAPMSMSQIGALIGAACLDVVALRHLGNPLHVLVVDDQGHPKGLPVNAAATVLYHANCIPGATHVIRGDAVVLPDDDFAPVYDTDSEGGEL